MINVELLSPSGDMECVHTAVRYGADAIYIGGPLLQLRADNVSFSKEAVKEAVNAAHAANKKLYVTVNSYASNDELLYVPDYANFLEQAAVDAVIVADLGVLSLIKKHAPNIPIHISTQANCVNFETARMYYELGASRVILGREASIEEIAVIRAKTPSDLALECFVHGAMCMSYSGRCLISSFLTGRSGNRGECTQACRWEYYLMEQKRPNEFFEIIEDSGHTAILSSHDLNSSSFLDELYNAGISSFKIEGRMKSPYYIATVVNAYRMAIDKTASKEDIEKELLSISHRPYSSGFYFGELKKNTFNDGLYHSNGMFAGVALSDTSDGRLKVMQRNRFKAGDELEILSPGKIGIPFTVLEITDENGESIKSAPHPKQTVTINCPISAAKGDIIRLVKNRL
ncbi:MAG: U32 family peptidase [Clostridiales bacterium]|nr:U32 family peptidase [Clostridiales bacterium]